VCFFAFFGAKIWPAAAGTGELARDLRDQTLSMPAGRTQQRPIGGRRRGPPPAGRGQLGLGFRV
jgi:hypothetical protein